MISIKAVKYGVWRGEDDVDELEFATEEEYYEWLEENEEYYDLIVEW